MFLAADREFLDVLEGGRIKTCTIEDGVRVLTFIETARRSNALGRVVDLPT
jgi:hypothetical protein